MGARVLTFAPAPALRRRAEPVTEFAEALRRLAAEMIETMHANDGVGLAAPQVGESLRLCVVGHTQRRGEELLLANPVIEAQHGRAALTEGCLSLPGAWAKVKRSAWVRVAAQDRNGNPFRIEAEGLLAIILQHECDHLDGRLFVDRLSWPARLRLRLRRRVR
ncbi:MAG TPA: peptide deformylase [bacterium]